MNAGEGIVALYAAPNPFLLNKICLNQETLIFLHSNELVLRCNEQLQLLVLKETQPKE